MKRSAGTPGATPCPRHSSSMLIVVGLPAATVTPWRRRSSKKRDAENFFAITSVAPQASGASTPSKLCGGPVEGAEIVDAVVGRHAEAVGHRLDIAELLAIAQHHALGAVAGARGEDNDGVVARGRRRQMASPRRTAADRGEERTGCRRVPAAERQPGTSHGRCARRRRRIVVVDREPRLELRDDAVEMAAVHLDMDGADGRPIGHHADIAGDVLDRIAGERARCGRWCRSPRRAGTSRCGGSAIEKPQ